MNISSTDRIDKEIELRAPVSRVWRALTDYQQFSQWFGVNLEVPFVVGQRAYGNITYPGCEHLVMEVWVEQIEPETYFSYRWHPYAVDPQVDYSRETMTLVEFRIEPTATGTRLRVSESGFDALPESRRDIAFRMDGDGWAEQCQNIEAYLQRSA